MSLADKIIERNERGCVKKPAFFNYDLPARDELGMPTANCLEYLIARILYVDNCLSGPERLHLRDYDNHIWEGDHWVAENSKNIYRLLKWQGKALTQDQQAMVWARLRDYLPTLSDKKIVVKDNLVWDKEKNELYFEKYIPHTIN